MRSSIIAALVAVTTVAAPAARAQAPAATDFSIDVRASTVTYGVVHKLHKFDGVSHSAQGKARLLPTGQVQLMVRAPVESFDSGNSNRDEHMKEVVEAVRFPNVDVKAVGEVALPASFPTTVEKTFKAQVNFHGVLQTIDVPVKITFESDKRITTAATFNLSLDGFKIERPSLMFVKVDDGLKIESKLVFNR
jgi:hypothetical protein